MSTPTLIAIAFVAPLILAAAVGFPTWFAARTHESYLKLREDYRAAVGIEATKATELPSGSFRLPSWMLGYYGYLVLTGVLRTIHPSVGFTAHILIFAGLGFWFVQRSFSSYVVLRQHPELEARLRRVPRIEIVTWSLVALLFFTIVHLMVVVGAPEEFGHHSP